jgi:hypothetical protein
MRIVMGSYKLCFKSKHHSAQMAAEVVGTQRKKLTSIVSHVTLGPLPSRIGRLANDFENVSLTAICFSQSRF